MQNTKNKMEIKIKNTKDVSQKAVIFGYYDDCYELVSQNDNPFFNLKTDEGIEIEMNGDKTIEGRLKIVENKKDKYSEPIFIDFVEYESTTKSIDFICMEIDANGQKVFNHVYNLLRNKDGVYIGKSNEGSSYNLRGIDCNTSWLFNLAPHQEIKLTIVEKVVISQMAKI